MQKYKSIIFLIVTAVFFGQAKLSWSAEVWQELKGQHFIVYYMGEVQFAKDVSYEAEKYYKQIAYELGYQRYSEFWIWQKRVKIFIYPDKKAYVENTGAQSWSEGMADYTNKQIISYAWSRNFLEELLPHEITHLIFRDYVGFKGEVPIWLDEGVAQWMEPPKREAVKTAARKLLDEQEFLPLLRITELDPRQVGDKKLIEVFYIQSVSVIGFLIEEYGGRRFADFCRKLRDGARLNEALVSAYPASLKSVELLEQKWRDYIKGE